MIDTHVHLWDHGRGVNPWFRGQQRAVPDRFTISELGQAITAASVDKAVLVEAVSSIAETEQLLRVAATSPIVAGVVGWVDLSQPDVDATLAALREGEGGSFLRGVRVQLAAHALPRPGSSELTRGVLALASSGLALDILTTWEYLADVAALARAVPQAQLVLDHFAYPEDDPSHVASWRDELGALAPVENVAFKLSAINHLNRDEAAFAIGLLGPERMMFGSDWPLCLRFGSYLEAVALAHGLVEPRWHDSVFGKNANFVYQLDTSR